MNEVVIPWGPVPTREQINALERELAVLPTRIKDIPTFHHFAPGLYVREVLIPAGTVCTGKIHKTTHLCRLESGEMTCWTERGMVRIRGPFTWLSYPGAKRAVAAHSDCVMLTYHVTEETDLERLEAELIEPSDNLQGLDWGCQFAAIEGGPQ